MESKCRWDINLNQFIQPDTLNNSPKQSLFTENREKIARKKNMNKWISPPNHFFLSSYMQTPRYTFVVSILLIVFSVSCGSLASFQEPKLMELKIGTDISQETGRIISESYAIAPSATNIYFEGFLDVPENSIYILEFRWYHNDELMVSNTNKHGSGYLISFVERDPDILSEFPSGDYRIEVWFVNKILASKSFVVR